ncbi:MAG TPA: multicopper oxidase domain-containing protein [Candidatus Thermoplasmatota archaeon]|nr:multicopper oxidase domain-containing protein [Candidatus Thermoplasmatota archaeon]
MTVNRRSFLKAAAAGGAVVAAGAIAPRVFGSEHTGHNGTSAAGGAHMHGGHPGGFAVERQQPRAMTPMEYLTHFHWGDKVTQRADGTALREYTITSHPQTLEVAKGVTFPGWVFSTPTIGGMAPGPTLRAREGDTIRIVYRNTDKHPHSMHFHGIHPGNQDGVFELVPEGGEQVYEFTAEPFGVHLYHCHTLPITKHLSKGLFGTLIIDPAEPREQATEMVMMMNGWDVDFDGANEFYTVNGIANYYNEHPIRLKVGEKVRIYLVNVTEFDLINSFHLHANFFKYYPTGTRLDNWEFTDTIIQGQGQRGILEFAYKHPGKYFFHAHVNEFAELGWVGLFEVVP